MIFDPSKARIFVRPGQTDLRKAVSGLVGIVEKQMAGEAFSGDVYLFCNRERKLLKAIYWDKTGFWLCQKRLEKDTRALARFPWPQDEEAVRELSAEQLQMLLAGIDFFKAHKPLSYKKVA
jgi:transposase